MMNEMKQDSSTRMDKNKNEKIEAILEKIPELPEEMQRTILWVLGHWDLIECLCKGSKMTDEEIDELKLRAKEKRDYLLLVLVCAVQVFNSHDETKKQPNR